MFFLLGPLRDDCDIEIMVDLMKYSLEKEPPFSLAIVSNDADYLSLVHDLRSQGCDIYILASETRQVDILMLK